MKLTINSTFDYATVANTKSAQELKPFIDHYNQSLQAIVKLLKGRASFADQFFGEELTVTLQHGVESKVSITRRQVLGIIPLMVNSSTDALESLVTSVNQEGQLLLTPEFKSASTNKIEVTIFILYPDEV